jgi:hypothetical protein
VINRCVSLVAVIACCLSATSCGGSARPFTPAAAKRPFLARGFAFGCPNIQQPLPNELTQQVNIALHGTTDVCLSKLGSLSIYRSAVKARQACAPSTNVLCGPYQYRVRNVVLTIDPSDSPTSRSRLLKALRSLGPITRIA